MTKYIKGKDGKFKGSIGSGKTSTPTSAPIRPGAVIDTADLFAAFEKSNGAPVRLADVARNPEPETTQETPAGNTTEFTWADTIKRLGGRNEQDSAERTANEHLMRMRFSTPEQFQEEVLSKKFVSKNPEGAYVFSLDNTDSSYSSSIHYHPGYDTGFFEVVTSNAEGVANSEDIPEPHLAAIRDELQSRGIDLGAVGERRF